MLPRLPWLLLAVACLVPFAAGAGSWKQLEGPVTATPPGVALGWGPGAGTFALVARGEDLRESPGVLVLETTAGWLVAIADEDPVLYEPQRRDPYSGRALRPDAPPDAVCETGAEPHCRQPHDPARPGEEMLASLCRLRWSLDDCPLDPIPLAGLSYGAEDPTLPDAILAGGLDCGPWRSDCSVPEPWPPEGSEPRCSFLTPWFCSTIRTLLTMLWGGIGIELLPDDPRRQLDPSEIEWVWLWEVGARYPVLAAGGELVGFNDGVVHVLGPERSRYDDSSVGVPLLLAGPEGAEDVATALYYAVPEPSAGALAGGALAPLALLALRRSRAAARRGE